MTTQTTTGHNAQNPELPPTLEAAHQRIAKLSEALEMADCHSQTLVGGIDTVACLALLAMQAPCSHANGNADLILTDALELIGYLAADATNCINSTAEAMGRNYRDEASRLRAAARYEGQQAGRNGGTA